MLDFDADEDEEEEGEEPEEEDGIEYGGQHWDGDVI